MSKNLKLSYILFFIISTIVIAFKTLSNFLGGVGLNFVALIALVFVVLLLCFNDKELIKRIRDLLILASLFVVLETVIYFACEFGYGESLKGFSIYQNIISFIGILFLGYLSFRFILEFKGKQLKFIEIILGNIKPEFKSKKAKKTKELSNGCLQEKPNCVHNENTDETIQESNEETTIIIETEE